MNFDLNTIARFSKILRYNVETYLDLYRLFISNNQPSITQYYKEPNATPDALSFDFLSKLLIEAKKVNDLIKIHSTSFTRIDDWDLVDLLENIRIKLDTIDNTSKWLRSSKTKTSWRSVSIQYNKTLGVKETLEDISRVNVGDNHPQDDWVKLSLQNNLFESDYDLNGGQNIQLSRSSISKQNIFLNSVIDNLYGEKLYGIDFNKKLTFTDDDLTILTPKDTVIQSIEILIMLKKGEVPEFNGLGVDANLTVGSDLSVFANFKLAQQLKQVFGSDDTLRNFNVTGLSYYNGAMKVDYSVDTMFNFTYKSSQIL